MKKEVGQSLIILFCTICALWGLTLSGKGLYWILENGFAHDDFPGVLFLTTLFLIGGSMCGITGFYLFKIR